MKVTRAFLINPVYRSLSEFTRTQSIAVVELFFEIIKARLEKGEDVLISGFGKFCVTDKTARRGRNPQTGNALMLDARRVVVFKPSGKLRQKVNLG